MRLARRSFVGALAALPLAARAVPGPRFVETNVGEVAVRLAVPPGRATGFVVFSHGANSNAAKYDRLTGAWAARGWLVASALHRDSPDHPGGGKVPPDDQWRLRLADMLTMLDGAAALAATADATLPSGRIAAAGHSFGALVAQGLAGAVVQRPAPGLSLPDRRVRSVVAFSPPGPIAGYVDAAGWAKVARPQFVQTGTADVLPIIAPTWEAHTVSYAAATVSPRVLWVGETVDHYFGNLIGRPERQATDQSAAFALAAGAAADFLDWTVRGDRKAERRLRRSRAGGVIHRIEIG